MRILGSAIALLLFASLFVSAQSTSQSEESANADEVRHLKDQLRQQQQQIDHLSMIVEQLLRKQQTGESAAPAQQPTQQAQAATQAATTYSASEKQVAKLQSISDRFRLGGDVRLRYEPVWQASTQTRNRGLVRVRLGVEGKISEDFVGGAYLATGTLDNPTSTNQTLTGNFTRFGVGIDRGWITYKPKAASWMELTGGKFAFTWNRSSLTFDPDLNPEGFSEKFTLNPKSRFLKQVSVTGLQLLFNEVAGIATTSGADSFAVGGQVSGNFTFGDRVSTTISGLALNWRNTDEIAQAIAGTTRTLNGNRNTNATVGTGANLRFASKFLYADILSNTTVNTGMNALPLRVLLDWVVNPRAASGENMGYFAEAALGRSQERNDIQFGYSFARVEQDAVIAAFNESEFRAPTNVLQHRVFASWLPQRNTTVLATYWLGRTLNSNLSNAAVPANWPNGEQDPLFNKVQLDLIYKF